MSNSLLKPIIMKRGLCASCSEQDEDEAPLSCICEWCLIRSYQKAWKTFDTALGTISGMGGPASDIAVKARNEARNMSGIKKQEGTLHLIHPIIEWAEKNEVEVPVKAWNDLRELLKNKG